jgi:hypothetical protein
MEGFLIGLVLLGAIVAGVLVGLFGPRPAPDLALRCPHCGVRGQVTVTPVVRKKGISGGKATAALLTGGTSMLATGLSRKEPAVRMTCGSCGTTWHVT